MDFDELVAGGEPVLRRAVEDEMQESLGLDFKLSGPGGEGAIFSADGKLTKDGRRILGKAISAFGNSAGGLIVIGVDCRRDADGVDRATACIPIAAWRSALSAVNSAVGELLQPKHESIRVSGFPSDSDPAVGYMLIDVPRSDRRPHMCQSSKQYFKRAGSASYMMEHFDIEDAMKRQAAPDLILSYTLSPTVLAGPNVTYELGLHVANVGQATAFYPMLQLGWRKNFELGFPNHVPNVHRESASSHICYGNSDFVIHPGQERLLERLSIDVLFVGGAAFSVGSAHVGEAYMDLSFDLFARDMRKRSGTICLRTAQFIVLDKPRG